ncbi:MAG: prepilin-type N-terminal cleavage/methylation domain-containing protein [Planctomycetes bacterium]|nr:prepilin-type N-terminal cleavage/methylation domain-containing protein [Planctomycetota bacterium]MCP4770348.1 prepilin-type N-terminal cleavage/methylation domain-containing protein [Planctomycetota bacterium]MCP4861902.1 prepilin-type N-terminal cleavage/methylation domain-containing protein [Planctomycetota bacterium]
MARSRTLKNGFSLVEVVMVVAIALVMFGMAVPAAQNNDIAGTVARSIVSDAVRARSYSRRTWEAVTMQVDTVNERWRTLREDGTPLTSVGANENGWHDLPPGASFETIENMPSDLVFLPNGRASQSASIHVVFGHHKWLLGVDGLSARIYAEPVGDIQEGGEGEPQ